MKLNKKIKNMKKEWKNIFFNIIFAVITLLIAVFLYEKILPATILLALIALIGLMKWNSKITLIIFIIGAIGGAFAEIYAINNGVWSYSVSNFKNIPVWLFIVWGNAAAFIYRTGIEIKRLGVKK